MRSHSRITRSGNAIRRRLHPYSADGHSSCTCGAAKAAVHRASSSRRARAAGCPTRIRIFIVGLPRAGSTLLEQILASHSLVEGTMELPDLPQIARELARARRAATHEAPFSQAVAALTPGGAARPRRALPRVDASHTARPAPRSSSTRCRTIACMSGLIQLILPNAKIIDARRHPLGCCFSAFKQHFARGQNFTYDLEDIGRYYRDYVELMAHFDTVLPGRVHRVFYEAHDRGYRERGPAAAGVLRAAVRGRDACGSMRTSGRCARQARSRCASPFSGREWISGAISSPGSGR